MSGQKLLLKRKPGLAGVLRHIFLGWLTAATLEYLLLPRAFRDLSGLDGLKAMSFVRVLGVGAALALLFTGLSRAVSVHKAERWGMAAVFALYAAAALSAAPAWPFWWVYALVLGVLVAFALRGWNDTPEPAPAPKPSGKIWLLITISLSLAFFLFVCAWTVGRFYTFSTPSFDFGIFSQMFYYMKTTGLPMTTIERDGLLSHFAVHVSPIYYLLLPFYILVPHPATLQVLQAAVIASAVIPLWLLGKHHGLSGGERTLLCAVLLLFPAFSGGTSYDIHENCFLTPLILWLFYGIHRKNRAMIALSALLTLMVKEDAPVYVAVIGLWLLVRTGLRGKNPQDLITGAALLAASVGWFCLVTAYLADFGDGVMTYRYQNFLYDGSSSLLTVIKAVLLCPMKVIQECVDGEKLRFIALTLLPLLGLPLLTRRYERYLLLIPYILVNLMPDYSYQHSIFFQYTFGSTAFLLYLTVVNLADWRIDWLRVAALGAAAAVSFVCFYRYIVPKGLVYPRQAMAQHQRYEAIRNTLEEIPEDASVAAGTFYASYLSQREILYDIRYSSQEHLLECAFIVIDFSAPGDYEKFATQEGTGLENLLAFLKYNGYEEYKTLENVLGIYYRSNGGVNREIHR